MPDYIVKITAPVDHGAEADTVTTERLVRAKTQAQAVAHVVDHMIAVKIADTEDVIRCTQHGAKLEIAE